MTSNAYIDPNHEEKKEGRKDRLEDRAARAAANSDRLAKEASDMASVIPMGQPILIGHHSEKRDRNYRNRIGNKFSKSAEEQKKAGELAARADGVGTGGIASNDPEALEKLQERVGQLQAKQEHMKAVNKAIRSGNDQPLLELGMTAGQIELLKEPDFCGRRGYPSYALQNNNANIRRLEKRIRDIEGLRESEPVEIEGKNGFKVYTEDGYYRIDFDRKPKAEVRAVVKSHGFRWSRFNAVWQRKATPHIKYRVSQCAEELNKFENLYG